MIKEINIQTTKRNEIIDITDDIQDLVKDIDEGLLTIHIPHTTCAITINENADFNVKSDILKKLSELIPEHDNYNHAEGNSDSHLKASIMGFTQNVIIKDGKLLLGTWQGIWFCEFDGPRTRKIIVKY